MMEAHTDHSSARLNLLGASEQDSAEHAQNRTLTLLSTDDVAAMFSRSERTIRRWVTHGRIPSVRIGQSLFFHPEDIDALIQERLSRR